MDYIKKLFSYNKLYECDESDHLFFNAMKQSIEFHSASCVDYKKILNIKHFEIDSLRSIEDLHLIPPVPTMFYKGHQLMSVPQEKMIINSTTSGTSGVPTKVGLDFKTCFFGAQMLRTTLSYHKLFSSIPTNYIVLGYQPSKHNNMGAVKTAFGATFLAPPLHREYALKDMGLDYELNIEGIKNKLLKYNNSAFPVRFVGFPSYMFFMMKMLKENNVKLNLSHRSKILLGGGWKQFYTETVDKYELYQMADEVLGIKQENIKEFFAFVESNVLYCDCKNHHFHVPAYGRVIVRDPKTFEPLPNGEPGLLNLISPLVNSMPLGSIMTDDIAVMYDGESCGCGIKSPYFEILGRAGMAEVKTCAAGANETLQAVSR